MPYRHAILAVGLLPAIYALTALVSARCPRIRGGWVLAEVGAFAALLYTLASLGMALSQVSRGTASTDVIGSVMASLVGLLGWLIIRYSARYLEGESRQRVYLAAMLLTLAFIGIVVRTDNLAVLVAAWAGSSMTLHFLLTFYNNRAAALVAAHKKFMASRVAEICLVTAVILIYEAEHTLSLSHLSKSVAFSGGLSPLGQAAVVLIAVAAILKSAQLPIHGWLIQVMEAPTPVSALLHAGIVNLGGFVLLRLAIPLSHAFVAQLLLLCVSGATVVGASLIMITRNSIKVRLAWSTCAQMGFMLLECALGFYDLALLHLLAHSFYKAHAFLSAGDTVRATRTRSLRRLREPARSSGELTLRLMAGPVAVALAFAIANMGHRFVPGFSVPMLPAFIVGFGVAPLLWPARSGVWRATVMGAIQALALMGVYFCWHFLFSKLFPSMTAPSAAVTGAVSAGLATLYATQTWFVSLPRHRATRLLYPWAHAGLFLDEIFTRLSLHVWPLRARVISRPEYLHRRLLVAPGERL